VRFAYLHGFASSPLSKKALALAPLFEAHGHTLARPDLNAPSFAELTFSGALGAIDRMDAVTGDAAEPWCLIGSSMGGYLAARWAELHADRVARLVLLCPGFGMTGRWPRILGAAAMARWRAHGALPFPDATGRPTPVHWGFIEDALRHPEAPEVPCPTLIVHGVRDETVPIASSREYAAQRPHLRLLEVDDDHSLGASHALIAREVLAFFGLVDSAAEA